MIRAVDVAAQLDAVLDLLRRLDIEVRQEHLGGSGGGLCTVQGRRIIFIDIDTDLGTRLERCARALSSLPESEEVYVAPALRELIDRLSG